MTLSRRFWWALVATAILAAGLTGGVGWFAARSLLLRQVDADLTRRADLLARHPGMVRSLLVREAQAAASEPDAAVTGSRRAFAVRVVGPGGRTLRSNAVWPDTELGAALSSDPGASVVALRAGGGEWRVTARPLRLAADAPRRRARSTRIPPGTRIQVALRIDQLQRDLRTIALLLALVGGGVVALSLFGAARLRDALLAPLERLRAGLGALDAADVGARLTVDALPQELEQLRADTDALLQRLAAARRRERRTLADIAHELRTPLAALHSRIGFARTQGSVAADEARRLSEQLDVLQRRLEGLLLLTRFDAEAVAPRAEACAVVELLAAAWAPLAERAQFRGLALEISGDEDVEISSDPALGQTVFANLLGNAVDHASGAGRIAVRLARRGATVHIAIDNPAAAAEPGPRPAACDPFWRADTARSDTGTHAGLGLAVVARIATAHAAAIGVAVTAQRRFQVSLDWPAG